MSYNVSILVLAFSTGSDAGGRGEADGTEVGSNSGRA
jgi:hypothetical protein